MEIPDLRLSLSASGLNYGGDSSKSKTRSTDNDFGYQVFENGNDDDFSRRSNLQFDQLDVDSESRKPDESQSRRRANGFGGKKPLKLDDDEVEECQIRHYGGPLSRQDFRKGFRSLCSWNTLQRRVPISLWLPHYTLTDLSGDLVAGLTVGLTVVPQALAYAQIADLPLEYGLYSAFMGPFIYTIFGTSKDVTVGPTALLALLTSAFLPHRVGASPAAYAVILSFFCGIFQLLMGILNLGFLMNFVSTPVMSGFTTAASIIIILGQTKGLLGISFGRSRDNIFYIIRGYIYHIAETKGWDVLLGAICIAAILLLKSLAPLLKLDRLRSKQTPFGWKILRELIKIVCYARYALVVIIATAVAASLTSIDGLIVNCPLTITHEVDGRLPNFIAPDFTPDNKTFVEVVDGFGAGLVLIPIIGLFESIVVAKAFSHRYGYTVDSTQEFIALGIANIMGSFVSSFPVTGAFSRTALNAESGVRTPLGGIITGAFVLISMSVLSPVLQFIPKAALSAVIISAIFVMIDIKIFQDLWRVNRIELIPLVSTLLLCLFLGVQYGLPLGIGISLLMLVYPLARPLVTVEYRRTYKRIDPTDTVSLKTKPKFNVTVTPHSALYFPSAEFFKDIFAKDLLNPGAFRYGVSAAPDFLYESIVDDLELVEERKNGTEEKFPPIVFDGIHLTNADYSTVRTMRNVVASCRAAGRDIVFTNTTAHQGGAAALQPSSGFGINSHDFMRLVQCRDEGVQMESLPTTQGPIGFPSSSSLRTQGSSTSLDKEKVAISTPGQIATYSTVNFPSIQKPDSEDLHLHT